LKPKPLPYGVCAEIPDIDGDFPTGIVFFNDPDFGYAETSLKAIFIDKMSALVIRTLDELRQEPYSKPEIGYSRAGVAKFTRTKKQIAEERELVVDCKQSWDPIHDHHHTWAMTVIH
jgi:hypothetical protein